MRKGQTILSGSQIATLEREYARGDHDEICRALGGISRSQLYYFAKRRGLKRDADAHNRNVSRVLCEKYRKERMMMRWGLPRTSERHLVEKPFTHREYNYRYRFFKRGYILGDYTVQADRRMVFYDDATDRAYKMERNAAKLGFGIKRLEE